MEENIFVRMSIDQRRDYCRRKISEHSPPETPHDEFMIKVYAGLLDLQDDPSLDFVVTSEAGITGCSGETGR